MTPAPTVEMLWESVDPIDALRDRFEHADAVAAEQWLQVVLRDRWNVDEALVERILISDRNALAWVRADSRALIAKWSVRRESFVRLAGLAEVATWLAAKGMPVAAPIRAVDGRVQVEFGAVSMQVQPVVPGDHLDVADLALVRRAGMATARLHSALAAYPADLPVPRSDSTRSLVDRWLADPPGHLPVTALAELHRRFAAAPKVELPVQLVHGDLRAANIICAGGDVAAFLDFEEARVDSRIVELARGAVLLGTLFRDWGPVAPEVRRALLDGYESVSPLSDAERAWFDVVELWMALIMVPAGDDPTGWGAAARSAPYSTTPESVE